MIVTMSLKGTIPVHRPSPSGSSSLSGICHFPIQHQGQLREHDHKHEVATQNEKLVYTLVLNSEAGCNDAVDANADPEGINDLLFASLWPDHLLVEVPRYHCGGGQHGGVGRRHDGSRDCAETKESNDRRGKILQT